MDVMSKPLQISHTWFPDNSIKVWPIEPKPAVEIVRWFIKNKQVNNGYQLPYIDLNDGYEPNIRIMKPEEVIQFDNDTNDVWHCKCPDPNCKHGIVPADGVY